MLRTLVIPEEGPIVEMAGANALASFGANHCWIDVVNPNAEEMQCLASRFGLHNLAIEDCLQFNQMPKIQDYSDHIFFVTHAPGSESTSGHPPFVELHSFLSREYLITVHDQPMSAIDEVWHRLKSDPTLRSKGLDFVRYLITDAIVEAYRPLIEELQNKVDALEAKIIKPAVHRHVLADLLHLRKRQIALRDTIMPQRTAIGSLSRIGSQYISDKTALYFRDAHDNLSRITDTLAANRDLLESIINAYHWSITQRTNEVVKRLTLLSAFFMPLTFITGFFGQNFKAIPFDSYALLGLMLSSCVIVPIVMMTIFFRSRWF